MVTHVDKVVDLRTDADSCPCLELRQAMIAAPLGFGFAGEDIATNQLEEKMAELMGKEAALFCITGIMSNEIAVMAYCSRGDEVILGDKCHIIHFECGGASGLAGAMMHTVHNDCRGMMNPREVEAAIRLVSLDYHSRIIPHTKLVCIENTHNICGGTVLTIEDQQQIAKVAHRHGVPIYCDGARFVNAAVYLGVSFAELARDLDALCFGFGKSLGAYTGSVLCGSTEFISKARNLCHMLGGDLVLPGVLAAGCLWALEHSVDRIIEDHANARILGEAIANMRGLTINLEMVQTDLVIFDVECMTPEEYVAKLKKNGVLCMTYPSGIRMVTDNTVSRSDVGFVIDAMNRALKSK